MFRLLALFYCLASWVMSVFAETAPLVRWEPLPAIPDPEGFAAPFSGVHADKLIVAGGANFPDKKPWEGGTKVWYDDLFVLEDPSGSWRKAGKLPRPLAYGVSVSTPEGLICIGGSDATGHHAEVFRIQWETDRAVFHELPKLPQSRANLSGALLGRTIYVVGGTEKPDSLVAANSVWSLDLDALERGWQEHDVCPGPGRMLASTGTAEGSLFVFSGAALKAGPDGKALREWLRDGYRFTPGKGWTRIADTPQVAVAAPNPMPVFSSSRLLLLGGDDGVQVNTAPTDHKGFPQTIFAYDVRSDRWAPMGALPTGLVTTSAVLWRDLLVIPGGEIRPGTRSNLVWATPFQ
jgi:N-acetylneuraminic acid mutarotase